MGLSFLSIVMTAGAALGDWNNDSDNYGATTWLSLSKGPPRWKGDDGKSVKPTAKDLVEYDYTVVPACERNDPRFQRPEDVGCMRSVVGCNPAPGPMFWVFRQTVLGGAAQGDWRRVGQICGFPTWSTTRPAVTMPMIETEFKRIAWAKLGSTIQPPKGVTLVNLKTYFQARWEPDGFQPGEVASVDLLGNAVDIRPVLLGYTYVFGDGDTTGPTLDPGGDWKTGKIFHVYLDTGQFAPRIDATLAADFRINGGEWARIPAEANITGIPNPLRVAAAKRILIR